MMNTVTGLKKLLAKERNYVTDVGCSGLTGIRAPNSSYGILFSRVWVRVPVMTLMSLSKTRNYNCFSPPTGKQVPVRAEMVLVIDLVEN